MTPDLVTEVQCEALEDARVRTILNLNRDASGVLPILPDSYWTLRGRKYAPRFEFVTFHDYLGDEADWDAPTWIFEPEGLRLLRDTMEWLYPLVPETFTFQAVWTGDPIQEEREVSRKDLLNVISRDEIGTHSRYRVASEPSR